MSLHTPDAQANSPSPLQLPGEIARDQAEAVGVFQEHPEIIGSCLATGILEDATDGVHDGVTWHRTERLGKHQRVAIVDFTTHEGTVLPAVIRPTYGDFRAISEEYPVVAGLYPQVYGSLLQPSDDPETSDREVLAIEKINGPHGDCGEAAREQYNQLVQTPEGFDQLSQDMFTAVDRIFDFPLAVVDVNPAQGHNVVYNTMTQHFQFFDVDTLKRSEASHVEKFLNFVQNGLTAFNNSPVHLNFAATMIAMYRDAYPDRDLSYESPTVEAVFYEVADETQGPDDKLIYPGKDGEHSDQYWDAYWGVERQLGSTAAASLMQSGAVFERVTKAGRYVSTINQEVLNALLAKDLTKFERLLGERPTGQGLVDTTFVEQ
jgi:hypothetical protein